MVIGIVSRGKAFPLQLLPPFLINVSTGDADRFRLLHILYPLSKNHQVMNNPPSIMAATATSRHSISGR